MIKIESNMQPEDIEKKSFEIIADEAGPHGFDDREWQVVRRMIHTSADFDYLKSVRFHDQAVTAGIQAIRSGKPIFTDTEMVRSGIRKRDLRQFGCDVVCLIGNSQVGQAAKAAGHTRAAAAVTQVADVMAGGIYAVGNAPTALLRLLELIEEKKAQPALIVGFPVGFVNAAESKAALVESGYPHIANVGRKGGSNVAASVLNALIIMAGAGN